MEKEQEVQKTKLDWIRERVEVIRERESQGCGCSQLKQEFQDRQDLLDIVDAAFGTVARFEKYASNIRYNNHENRTDWEARAKVYGSAALELNHKLDQAVEKL